MTKIILGYPYSGALLGYFSDEIGGGWSHTRRIKNHSYYRTLYGENYKQYVDLALTFLLLYDTVWITPADNHMPESRLDPGNRNYIPELDLRADWEDFRRADYAERELHIHRYLEDPALQQILQRTLKVPQSSWRQIVDSAVYEAGLSIRMQARLLCSPGRRLLIERLLAIDRPSRHPSFANLQTVQFVDTYGEFTGMALGTKNIDDLMESKSDPIVRAYGSRFLEVALAEAASGELTTRRRMAILAREAIHTERLNKLYAGRLKWAARLSHVVHAPAAATLASAVSYAASHMKDGIAWHEFSGKIDAAIDRAQFVKKLDEIIETEPDE
jgi:hypothetical protein